jgi:hypothetical protein
MLIDWFIYWLLIWGLVATLNASVFKKQPASRTTAWVLTIGMFFVNLLALTVLQFLRYKMISQDLGIVIKPRGPADFGGAFAASWFFFILLRKVPRPPKASPESTQKSVVPVVTQLSKPVPPENHSTIPLQAAIDEERVYAEIAKELETGVADKGLWTRLFAECGGDEKQTKVLYIKQRVERLIASERARLELAARESAKTSARAEIERLISTFVSGEKPTADDVARLAHASSSQSSISVLSDKIRGDTLLHWCARLSLEKEAAILIANGANPNAPNGNGRRPFEVTEELALRAAIRSAADAQPGVPADLRQNAGEGR